MPEPTSMNPDRRFTEDEVSEILDRATELRDSGGSPGGPAGGLTLRELKEIGREVGISEDAISRAAYSLGRAEPAPPPPPRFLGQAIGVNRTIYLPRPLTDEEWHRLVVELRETFDAKGKIREEGAFRQWTNSNLQALLEPTESGERLRLRTSKGNARAYQGVGASFMVASTAIALTVGNDPRDTLMMLLMGAGFFLASRLTVPSWLKTRTAQFEAIAARVSNRIGAGSVEGGEARDGSSLPPGGTNEPVRE